MTVEKLTRDAVLRVGEVSGVDGRKIYVLVDKNKNLSDMFFEGDILRNIAVNGYVEIRKGFLSIIGKVEGEKIEPEVRPNAIKALNVVNTNRRILTIALTGYLDEKGTFVGGTRELPLIGNEAYLVTKDKLRLVHKLVPPGSRSIRIATIFGDDFDVELPIDGLFNSHIAIFGNTGSGKTNTLACLYQELVRVLRGDNLAGFEDKTRFLLFDFNGEYAVPGCITENKQVYNLSTDGVGGDRLPMSQGTFLDIEVLSILADATEKTQKPFLRRTLRRLRQAQEANDIDSYIKAILRRQVRDALQMTEKTRAFLLIDYFKQILPEHDEEGVAIDLDSDLEWHNWSSEWRLRPQGHFLAQNPEQIEHSLLYRQVDRFQLEHALLARLITFLYMQLIDDVLSNRAQNEHIIPVINRLKSKSDDIDRLFNFGEDVTFWARNFVVINLHAVNLDMKKTIPLLLAKRAYVEHKAQGADDRTLNIIIDEAHNILSTESFREAESWKDYRLETFEEIIKEGRKFGVFVTISSQRPNDISPTITSQAHNYFIHRLINQFDLKTIASAVSYIDRVTEESIPTLPTGTCIFSGMASQMPLKININPLSDASRPRSTTRGFPPAVQDEPLA